MKEKSPLGPLFGNDKPGTDYYGYYFKILKAQGKHAPGGALRLPDQGPDDGRFRARGVAGAV